MTLVGRVVVYVDEVTLVGRVVVYGDEVTLVGRVVVYGDEVTLVGRVSDEESSNVRRSPPKFHVNESECSGPKISVIVFH